MEDKIKELEIEFKKQVNALVEEIKSSSKTYEEAIEKARSNRFDRKNNFVRDMYFEVEAILEREMKGAPIK